MKTYSKLIAFALALIMFNACDQDYIDGISKVDPGSDESAPQITINFPPEGYEIQTPEAVASVNIDFEVRDDIEISSISVKIDGAEIVNYSEFKDYRVAMEEYRYDNVTTGSHILAITATDINGKETTRSVSFTKTPPYVPVYEGEIFYMPFNNEFREMNTLSLATVVGSPVFADGIQGGTAYQGVADSYLTFPTSGLQGDEFSASFWMNLPGSIESGAGILVMGPEDTANPDAQNIRTSGFRMFYDNSGGKAYIKVNAGNGTSDTWVDGGDLAKVDPEVTTGWFHLAFTISNSEINFYINGELIKQSAFDGIDWTGCDIFSIMSGAPRFTGWGHNSSPAKMDELRLFNKALSQADIQTIMLKEQSSLYMDFNGDYKDAISGMEATVVGSPEIDYGGGVFGDAYQGAAASYLTFPATDILGDEFSAGFWMNLSNTIESGAGILVMGPEDTAHPDAQNLRTSGFRLFYDNSDGKAYIKVNAGNGTADTWVDGGDLAKVDPAATTGWFHLAFSISNSEINFYINGELIKQSAFDGIDWTGCDILSIMSGAPRFTEWGHNSCVSMMDELYLFRKALTADEVMLMVHDGM